MAGRRPSRAPLAGPMHAPRRSLDDLDGLDLCELMRRASAGACERGASSVQRELDPTHHQTRPLLPPPAGELDLPHTLANDPSLFSSALAAVGGAGRCADLLARPSALPPRLTATGWAADATDVADLLRAFDPGEGDAVVVGGLAAVRAAPARLPPRLTARMSDASLLLACLLEADRPSGVGGDGGPPPGGPLLPPPPRGGLPPRAARSPPMLDDGPSPLPSVFGAGAGASAGVVPPGVAAAAAVAAGVRVPAPVPVPAPPAAARAAAIARHRAKKVAPPSPRPPAAKRARGRAAAADVALSTAARDLVLPPGLTQAERRKEIRKANNRASALASRLRREQHAATLQARVDALERERAFLERSAVDAGGRAAAVAALNKRGGAGAAALAPLGTRRSTRGAGTGLGARHVTL